MIQRHIRCPYCKESFWQSVERRSDPPPDECPLCHNTGQKQEAALVFISKARRERDARTAAMVADGRGPGYHAAARDQLRSEEQVFRAMEAGSIIRAEAAASELNVPISEVSNLKITDMRDNVKTGEISAKLPLSQAGLAMQDQARQMSFAQGSNAAEYARAGGTIVNGTPVGTQVGPGAKVFDPVRNTAATPGNAVQSLLGQRHAQTAQAVESQAMKRG